MSELIDEIATTEIKERASGNAWSYVLRTQEDLHALRAQYAAHNASVAVGGAEAKQGTQPDVVDDDLGWLFCEHVVQHAVGVLTLESDWNCIRVRWSSRSIPAGMQATCLRVAHGSTLRLTLIV